MSKVKQYNTREFIKILEQNGFEFDSYCSGDHAKWKKQDKTIVIPVGKHSLNKMLCHRLIKENMLKV